MRQSNALPLIFAISTVASCHERRAAGLGAPVASAAIGARTAASAGASAPSASSATAMAGSIPAMAVSAQKEPAPSAPEAADTPPAVSCYAGFAPSGSPRVDVVRLGVSCGPVSGLVELAKATGAVDETGRGPTLRWNAERGDCFRLFAVAAEPVEDIRIDVKSKQSAVEMHVDANRRWAVVGEDGPFCAARAGHVEAWFTTHAGTGELVASVWRGQRMVRARPSGGPSEPSPAR